ncbi:MAG: hypothetical protein J6A98_04085 [Clostridia bacterium]|nr:hypothetical protein [Clostridia bacterium]
MIVSFCGHSDFSFDENDLENKIFNIFESFGKKPLTFYLGLCGKFDWFAHKCCKKWQAAHPNCHLVFVSPYRDNKYLKEQAEFFPVDEVALFDGIEKTPPKFAILKRNECVVNKSDFVIAWVKLPWGGAAKTLEYAKRKKKKFINIAK